jgi:MOSC domain-containing protein YiiM
VPLLLTSPRLDRCGAVATIKASYSADGASLRLEAQDLEPLEVAVAQEETASKRSVALFSGLARVVDMSSIAGEWDPYSHPSSHLSCSHPYSTPPLTPRCLAGEWYRQFCGVEGAALVRSDDDARTLADDWRASRVAYQEAVFAGEEGAPREIPLDDGGTILLVSRASVDELNAQLTRKGLAPVDMARFRPNLVVEGVPAHAEDGWLEVQVGSTTLTVERACTRCPTVLVDQRTGQSDAESGNNWLSKVLAKYRLLRADPAYGEFDLQGTKFGVYCTPTKGGEIRTGDAVRVLRRK